MKKKRKPKVVVVLEAHTPGQREKVVKLLKEKGARRVVLEATKEELETGTNVHYHKIAKALEKEGIKVIPGDAPIDVSPMMEVEEFAKKMLEEREKKMADAAVRAAEEEKEQVYLVIGAGHSGVVQELKRKGAEVKVVRTTGKTTYEPGAQLARFFRFRVHERYLPEEVDLIARILQEKARILEEALDMTGARPQKMKGEMTDESVKKYNKLLEILAKEGQLTYPAKKIREKRKELDSLLEKQDPEYKRIKEEARRKTKTEEKAVLLALQEYRKLKEKEYEKAFEKVYSDLM